MVENHLPALKFCKKPPESVLEESVALLIGSGIPHHALTDGIFRTATCPRENIFDVTQYTNNAYNGIFKKLRNEVGEKLS